MQMMNHRAIISYVKTKERHLSALALLVGFILDSFLLPRIDSTASYVVLGTYLCIAGALIVTLQMVEAKRITRLSIVRQTLLLTTMTQFFFGGLLSAIFIYYSRSASIVESWPFMLLLLCLLVGNELARRRYERLWFQLSIFFFVLFMGMSFGIPVLLGAMGTAVFLLSGIAALAIMSLFVGALHLVVPNMERKAQYTIAGFIGGIYLVMNIFYFAHVIPPIPLSLRAGEVAHHITRDSGGYALERESQRMGTFLTPPTMHIQQGAPLYFFSAVFAPTKLDTVITHEWEYYNEQYGDWEIRTVVDFPVAGGREGGYRGYSMKTDIEEGRWRVSVRTVSGAMLGRERFNVAIVAAAPSTISTQM